MAKITVTFNGVSHYASSSPTSKTTDPFSLATNKETATIFIDVGETTKSILPYTLSITDFSMHKKMYQPTEIIVDLSIAPSSGTNSEYKEIGRKRLEELFKHIKVSLSEGSFSVGNDFYVHEVVPHYQSKSMHVTLKIYSLDKLMTVNKASRTFVGKRLSQDILMKEVPKYITPWTIDPEVANLQKKIDKNADKMAKLLKEIDKESAVQDITDEEKKALEALRKTDPSAARLLDFKYAKRYLDFTDDVKKQKQDEYAKLSKEKTEWEKVRDDKDIAQGRMSYSTNNMQFLNYRSEEVVVNDDNKVILSNLLKNLGEKKEEQKEQKEEKKITVYYEHIFPYLVQYNESFYDMLARTTNRWGEFLYYENGTLNIGYNANATPTPIDRNLIQEISYCDLNAKALSVATDGKYDYEADNSSLTGKPLQKSPAMVKAQMGDFGGKADKWVMKQFATFFKNDKDLPTFATNWLIDNLFSLAMAESSVAKLNSDFNDKYFPSSNKPGSAEQYDQWDFSKKSDTETKILDGFQQFSEIGTSFDGKKYKTILEKEQTVGKDAICINFGTTHPNLKLGDIISYNNENFIVVEIIGCYDANRDLVFQVTGTAQDSKDKIFYPAVIPAGHVRYASPQVATITDPDDPTSKNRARVMFSWQNVKYEDDDDKSKGATAETIQQSTPWLNFASNQNGYPVMGYHYTGDQVMVGFEDGNVERPYILGGLADDFLFADCALASPGMHQLTLNDGYGDGLAAFLSGIFSPTLKNFMAFCPKALPKMDFKQNKYFQGGFELTDYYGIYKISGSTDGRNVSIASNWGDVKINAFTGISISAPNGDVKISGKNVTIEAGNNLKLVSGTNVGYKLWKSKDSGGGTLAQIMVNATAAVAKKITQETLGGIIDFSYIRSIVEIIFRPVEGSLTVKSNRFLKLEAGNNSCKFPESAFNKEEKLKILNAMNEKTIKKSLGLGPGMVKVFEKIAPIVDYLYVNYRTKYDQCLEKKREFENEIELLRDYSKVTEDANAKPCKTYNELKEDLWTQDKNEDWKEEKLGFKPTVDIEGELEDLFPMSYVNSAITINTEDEDLKKTMIKECREYGYTKRVEHRKKCLDALNELRKAIYETTHIELKRPKVSELFGHMNSLGMPKDYKDKLVTAFSKDKCSHARCYAGKDSDKDLTTSFSSLSADEILIRFAADITYLQRVAAMNLLDEFGFKDAPRKKVGEDLNAIPIKKGTLPPVPTKDDPYNFEEGSVMSQKTWRAYVNSLNAVPPIGVDKSTLGSALYESTVGVVRDKFFNWGDSNWNVVKSALEKKTWGEGKKGQILFAADKKTYAWDKEQFKEIQTLKPTVNGLEPENEGDAIDGFLNKVKNYLLKL